MIQQKHLSNLYLLLLIVLSCSNCQSKHRLTKPNIIIMLVDDAGYADFGFNGCQDLETPNIDRLASQGVVFTDAHVSASVCGPSRAGLITGRYQQRFGFECNPPSDGVLSLDEKTMASVLKIAGYTTAAFGKWHLGAQEGYRPTERGFDYYWGFLAGGRSYFPNPRQDVKGNIRAITENTQHVTFDGYLTDRLGDQAVAFIDRNKEKPFFMYWSPNAVHTPMEAMEEDLARYRGHPRQKLAALTWALYRAVGHITNKLEEDKLLDNTLIFFLSDNGGATNNQSINLPFKGFKGNEFEAGHRVGFFITWPAAFPSGGTFTGLTSALDIFATAVDAAAVEKPEDLALDGVSLLPFLTKEQTGSPHRALFWRKDEMAAARVENHKLVRVERLPSALYDLDQDLGETNNLSATNTELFQSINSEIVRWETSLMDPLWTEGAVWDTITWMIHQDLMLNRPVRAKGPGQLKRFLEEQDGKVEVTSVKK